MMDTIVPERKWHLIRNDNGEWISDDNAVEVSKEEVQHLKLMAMRANKNLSVQHGIEGRLWCYKHEINSFNKKYRNMKQTDQNKFINGIATLDACLDKEAGIYNVLKEQPVWWQKLLSIKGVYVEIRKGDIVDVYYEGGRIAELRCKNKRITATCHPKYLGKNVPTGSNPKYVDCIEVLKNNPTFITQNIQINYSQKEGKGEEDISEKKIQGDMICRHNPIFLDSEFAHRYEIGKRQTIRFDLVTIKNNQLIFIELKRIKDNRLLNKGDENPEILNQMEKYQKFIKTNKAKLLVYYKDLYEIKKSLNLPVPECEIEKLSVCEIPHLIIIDTYQSLGCKKMKRIDLMNEKLTQAPFSYTIEELGTYPNTIETLSTYEMKQQKQQELFRKSITNKGFKYILDDNERDRNLYNWQDKDSVQRIKDYFKENNIKWWNCSCDAQKGDELGNVNITRHLVSSQLSCINHLFFIKHDKNAVLSIINGVCGMPVKFIDVMNIPCDKGIDNYIAFEVVASRDYLHEKHLKRGEYCTSVDALVYALDENNERWLIPVEWKYTEKYYRDDKSNGTKGKTRLSRYCNTDGDNLIGNSKQLKSLIDYKHSIYFQEPFYQLMRQTLWAECICRNKEENVLPAEHFVHIHVCPKENKELLNKCYAEVTDKPSMEEAWREMLSNQSLYHLVDPKELLQPIAKTYPKLYNYLQSRYWQ